MIYNSSCFSDYKFELIKFITIVFLFIALFCICGCKSTNSNISSNSSTNFEIGIVEGKLSEENSFITRDIIYAYLQGQNITGGWLEDPQNKKIPNSELRYEPVINRYEVIVDKIEGGFQVGTYTLKINLNKDLSQYNKFLYKWNTLPKFSNPTIDYDTVNKFITVKIKNYFSYNHRYKLRIYNMFTQTLNAEGFETTFTEITERSYISYIQIMLIGDLYENQKLTARIIYKFLPTNL